MCTQCIKLERTALLWAITQRVGVIPYRSFGTTYQSNLQGSKIEMMEPIGCPETSVMNYNYSLHISPEERCSHQLRGGSLK